MLYPGRDGAESSVRYEMLREGLQATEARIFLERAVDKIADPALTREITALLDKRIHDTLFALVFAPHVKIEEYHSGWQSRSAALYAAAARVAGRIGVSAARNRLDIDLPARGSKRIAVDLRNWTGAKREWKVAAVHDWLRPARTSGSLGAGSEPLAIDVDADALEPGEPATGLLMLTDVRTGRTETVAVDARVSDVFRFSGPQRAINVGVGRSGSMAFTLLNPSGAELAWRITGQPGWLKVAPSTGRLAPGRQCGIALTAAPPDRRRAVHDVELTLAEAGGAVRRERLRVHVLPHRRPHDRRPAGRAVHLQDVPADAVVEYVNGGRKMNLRHGVRFYKPDPRRALAIGRKTPTDWRSMLKKYTRGIELSPRGELTYNIEGKGFTAFSAEVGWSSRSRIGREVRWSPRLHFELYVDGRLVDHSGLMDITDGPRLLVAEGLRSAKRIRLVTRFHNDGLLPAGLTLDGQVGAPGVWGDPRLHR